MMTTADQVRVRGRVLGSLVVWFGIVVVASASGWLGRLSPMTPPLVAGLSVLTAAVCYFRTPELRRYLAEVGLRRLTALHVLRIAAVPLFFWYGSRGLLPKAFVDTAGWGDLVAGLTALVVCVAWPRPAGYWTMHVVGMVDFFSAFAAAMRLTRGDAASMHAIFGLPAALIPFFAVGVLATTHIIAYDLLLRGRSTAAAVRMGEGRGARAGAGRA